MSTEKTPQKKVSAKDNVAADGKKSDIKIQDEAGTAETPGLADAINKMADQAKAERPLTPNDAINLQTGGDVISTNKPAEEKIDIVKEIKELRTDVDQSFSSIREWEVQQSGPMGQGFVTGKAVSTSAFVLAAHNHLMTAKAWMGELLALIGKQPSPYKSEYASVSEIAPTTEKAKSLHKIHDGDAHGQLKNAENSRANVGGYLDRLELIRVASMSVNTDKGRELAIAFTQVYVHLKEARFALGYEIGRIRDEEGK